MKSTLIFIHIPKTAGTTFLQILSKNYSADRSFTVDGLKMVESIETYKKLSLSDKQNLELIKGHFTLNLHSYLPGGNFSYVTFLREPFDHFISTYYYIKRTKEHNYYNEVNKMKSIEEFIDFRYKNNQDNLQTRHMSGSATDMSYNPIDFCLEGDKYFEIAKSNITNLVEHVFVSEHFDEALIYLKHKLGWKNITYRKANVTKDRPAKEKFSSDILDRIGELCKYDLMLYEIAKDKFKKNKSTLNIDWKEEIQNFESRNYLYNRYMNYFDKMNLLKAKFSSVLKKRFGK